MVEVECPQPAEATVELDYYVLSIKWNQGTKTRFIFKICLGLLLIN